MTGSPLGGLPTLTPEQRLELRRRIDEGMRSEKRTARAVFFIVSTVITVLFTAIAIGIALSEPALQQVFAANDDLVGVFILPFIAAVMGVLFHFFSLMLDTRGGEREMRTRVTNRALTELLLDETLDPDLLTKPKRGLNQRRYTLSDDGEIVPEDESAFGDDALTRADRRSS